MKCFNIFNKKSKIKLDDLSSIKIKPDVILFDYDGTINNNKKQFNKCIDYMIRHCFTKEEIAIIKKEYPKPDILIFDYLREKFSTEKMNEALKTTDEWHDKQRKIRLMRGVKKLIKYLYNNRFNAFVVSQKCGVSLRNDLNKLKLTKYFNRIYGSLDFGEEIHKPLKEFTDKIVEIEGLQDKNIWMIGDTINDVITAQNFGCIALIVDDTSYDIIVERYKDLIGKEIFFTRHKDILKRIVELSK